VEKYFSEEKTRKQIQRGKFLLLLQPMAELLANTNEDFNSESSRSLPSAWQSKKNDTGNKIVQRMKYPDERRLFGNFPS
jgi:hypothetical protein